MNQYSLSIRAFCLLLIAMGALLSVAGCGGGGDSAADASAGGAITVETGSLTKAEFVKRADEACEASKDQLEREYEDFVKSKGGTGIIQAGAQARLVNTMLIPIYEKLIDRISSLGVPSSGEEEVAAFLNATQRTLDKASQHPTKVFTTLTFFRQPAKLATAYGLTSCANSFG